MCKEATVTVPQRSDPTRFCHASSLPKPPSTKTATGSPEATSGCAVRGGDAVKKMSSMGGRVQPQKHKDLSLIPGAHRRMWDVVGLAGWWREAVLTGHPVWWGNGYRGTAFDCPLASLYTHIYMHLKTRTLHMISQNPMDSHKSLSQDLEDTLSDWVCNTNLGQSIITCRRMWPHQTHSVGRAIFFPQIDNISLTIDKLSYRRF